LDSQHMKKLAKQLEKQDKQDKVQMEDVKNLVREEKQHLVSTILTAVYTVATN